MRPRLLLLPLLIAGSAFAEETDAFPRRDGEPEIIWTTIEYPSRFRLVPGSLEGELKWQANFADPDSGLTITLSAYGYISDSELVLTIPGVTYDNYDEKRHDSRGIEAVIAAEAECKNCGDYFRAKILPPGSEESKVRGYERFIHRTDDRVTVYFLDPGAYRSVSGRWYHLLSFDFPSGTYLQHEKEITAIIASAKPPARPDPEEPAGPDPEPPFREKK